MDAIVEAALRKWPNVPHCHGWLALDARGNWFMRDERIQHAGSFGPLPQPGVDSPAGIPAEYGQHMDLMYDLLALAFQTDSTRIATLLLAGDGTKWPALRLTDGTTIVASCDAEENGPGFMILVDKDDNDIGHLG